MSHYPRMAIGLHRAAADEAYRAGRFVEAAEHARLADLLSSLGADYIEAIDLVGAFPIDTADPAP